MTYTRESVDPQVEVSFTQLTLYTLACFQHLWVCLTSYSIAVSDIHWQFNSIHWQYVSCESTHAVSRLIVPTTLLYKHLYYAQTLANSLALSVPHSPLSGQSNKWTALSSASVWWCIYPNFCLHIDSDCLGARSLLSKDAGEEVVTCELLPAIRHSLTGLVIVITESPCSQVSSKL